MLDLIRGGRLIVGSAFPTRPASPCSFNWLKKAKKLIVLALVSGIEFVIVTKSTSQRQPEENRGRGVNTIGHVFHAILFANDSAFGIDHVVPVDPVAICWSRVGLGSRSPASCSVTNWSKSCIPALKALIVQSRDATSIGSCRC